MINLTSTWNNLPKNCLSAELRLMKGYVQDVLRKELRIDLFVKHLNIAFLPTFC